jgi:tRNA A-37 threonylcarbamoyl transferase component Bud32
MRWTARCRAEALAAGSGGAEEAGSGTFVAALNAGYRIGEAIGHGAVARVVEVHAPDGRRLAGKILHESHRDDPAAAARFAQEAAILADLRHPNLVAVEGIVAIDGIDVLLMERVDGSDLARVLAREAPLSEPRLRALLRGIAAGLGAAHAAGVVHRDLKPSNVLMSASPSGVAADGTPKIADFGMARASSLAGVDPAAFAVLGTPDYMAPESIDPLAVDPRTDLYALGCIAFEAATGRPPYGGATPMSVIQAHREAEIPALPDRYGEGMRALVRDLLAKSPADRPPAAEAVIQALDRLESTPVALARRDLHGTDRCARCGRRVVVEAGVCIACSAPLARIEPGGYTLLVVGPGAPGDKLDSELRERLLRWLVDNPSLRLDPRGLKRRIPRLPFTLATRLSEHSGAALGVALRELGLETELVHGHALASPAMRTKTKRLWGRAALIVFTSVAGLWGSAGPIGVLTSMLLMFAGISVGTVIASTWRVTRRLGGVTHALPAPVEAALARIAPALPAIESQRHREGLRAVVERASTLARVLAPDDRETAHELARAVETALVTAARLDALDRELSRFARDEAGEAGRELLRERDTWAARLLALTAALDALSMRLAHARERDDRTADDELAAVRLQLEALEEVQAR